MAHILKYRSELEEGFLRCLSWVLTIPKDHFIFWSFRAALEAYGSSQAKGESELQAAGLHHSHSNAGSKPRLQPTPQLMAMPILNPTEQGQGLNPQPNGS